MSTATKFVLICFAVLAMLLFEVARASAASKHRAPGLGFTLAHGKANSVDPKEVCAFELTKRAYYFDGSKRPSVREIGTTLVKNRKDAYTQLIGWTRDLRALLYLATLTVSSCSQTATPFPFTAAKFACDVNTGLCKPWTEQPAVATLKAAVSAKYPAGHGVAVDPTDPIIFAVENVPVTNSICLYLGAFIAGKVQDPFFSDCAQNPQKRVYAAWSPDGKKLIYARNATQEPYEIGLIALQRHSSNAPSATQVPVSVGRIFGSDIPHNSSIFSWSPKSRYVYFRGSLGSGWEVLRLDTTRPNGPAEQMTKSVDDHLSEKAYPTVTPSGWLAYTGIANGVRDLALRTLCPPTTVTRALPHSLLGPDGFVLYPIWRAPTELF